MGSRPGALVSSSGLGSRLDLTQTRCLAVLGLAEDGGFELVRGCPQHAFQLRTLLCAMDRQYAATLNGVVSRTVENRAEPGWMRC